MKNKEKNASDIIDCAVKGNGFGVDKRTNKVYACDDICCAYLRCGDCLFDSRSMPCWEVREQWAEAEYIEPKVFTEEEKALIRLLDKAKYIARDKNGSYFAYDYEPVKDEETGIWRGACIALYAICSLKFDAIKWEDEKPTSREEILR